MADSIRNPRAPLSPIEARLEHLSWLLLSASLLVPWLVRYIAFRYTNLPGFGEMLDATIGLSVMNGSGLASVAILYFLARPSRGHLENTILLSLPLELLYMFNLPAETSLFDRFLMLGGGVGVAGWLALAHLGLTADLPLTRKRSRIYFRLGAVLLLYPLVAGAMLSVLSHYTPWVYDGSGYTLEASAGFLPCMEAVRLQLDHPWLELVLSSIYCRLPLWVVLAFALNIARPERSYFDLFSAFAISGVVVFVFYAVAPMVGIDDFLGRPPWPDQPVPEIVSTDLVQAPAALPRTCMPSMHMTWILLAWFAVRRISRKLGWAYAGLVICTALSAAGPRVGHYTIDFVPAFPFAIAWAAATAQRPPRGRGLQVALGLGGLVATLLFALAVRWQADSLASHPLAFWGLCFALIAATLLAEPILAARTLEENSVVSH